MDLFNIENNKSKKSTIKDSLYLEKMLTDIDQHYKNTNGDNSLLPILIDKIRQDYNLVERLKETINSIADSNKASSASYNLSSLKICSTDGKTNGELVSFAINFLEGNETNYEKIKQICFLKEQYKNKKSSLDEQLFIFQNTFVEYFNIQQNIIEYQTIINKMKLPFSRVKNGPKEILGLNKYDLKQHIGDLKQRLELLAWTIKATLLSASSIYNQIKIPDFNDIFASEKSFTEFLNLMTNQHSKMIEDESALLEKEIEKLSRDIWPEYLKLNFVDISRIVNLKRVISNKEQQTRLLNDLYSIYLLYQIKTMMQQNQKISLADLNMTFCSNEEEKEKTLPSNTK